MTFTKTQSEQAKQELRQLFDDLETSTVFVIQRHVSSSGMQRQLDLYILPSVEAITKYAHIENNIPRRITYQVAQALQWVYNEKWETVQVGGCGMDMHFHTVYSLSYALYCDDKYNHDSAYRLKHQTL